MKKTSRERRNGDRNSQAATASRNMGFTRLLLSGPGRRGTASPGDELDSSHSVGSAAAVQESVELRLGVIKRRLHVGLATHDGTECVVERIHVVGSHGAE